MFGRKRNGSESETATYPGGEAVRNGCTTYARVPEVAAWGKHQAQRVNQRPFICKEHNVRSAVQVATAQLRKERFTIPEWHVTNVTAWMLSPRFLGHMTTADGLVMQARKRLLMGAS